MTVRQHIYGEDEEEDLDFDNSKGDASSPPFKQANMKSNKRTLQQKLSSSMSRPLQIKKTDNKKSSREPTHRRDSNAAAAEQLSDIDEEEEKRMANAFKEANGPD